MSSRLFGFIILLCLYIIKSFRFVKLCRIRSISIGQQCGNTGLFLRRLQLERNKGKLTLYCSRCGGEPVIKLYPKRKIMLPHWRGIDCGSLKCAWLNFLRRFIGRKPRFQIYKRVKDRILYIGISGKPDNRQLLKMFKRKMPIIETRFAHKIFRNPVLNKSAFYEDPPFPHNAYYEWDNTEPDISFTKVEEEQGKELLKKMGIVYDYPYFFRGEEPWFVCIYARDSAFYLSQYRQYRGDFRNSDIKNYLEAAKYITSCGGFAVRMGSAITEKLPDLDNVIDYASYYRTDFGDIYLPAKCKFFLGDTGGLCVVPTLFNVPRAGTNYIPFQTPFRKGDLYIPKKLWSTEEKRFLTLREYIEFGDVGIGNIEFSKRLRERKCIAIENTAEEILGLAKEMNERLDGKFEYTEEYEELQNRFGSLLQPHHHCYGTPARIGTKFLQQNKELLK